MNFDDLKIPRCKNFTGYKPCYSYKNCLLNGCVNNTELNKTGVKILIISLDAMGNVLDNTPVLHSIKRKFPVSTIYWITKNDAVKVLNNSVLIDRVFAWDDESRLILRNIDFDVMYNADKSDYACAFANEIRAESKFGFLLNEDGTLSFEFQFYTSGEWQHLDYFQISIPQTTEELISIEKQDAIRISDVQLIKGKGIISFYDRLLKCTWSLAEN